MSAGETPGSANDVGTAADGVSMRQEDYRFRIDASVVFQLGESLVSDVVQAIVELIKNAYDADATWVRVVVNTGSGAKEQANIVIEDNGRGMTDDDIRRGWLWISKSPKRGLKSKNETTPRGRTPLGDKGLGRLGVQRLGDQVEIVTRAAGPDGMATQEYRVSFSWSDFRSATFVEQVPVVVEPRTASSLAPGTRITISELRDTDTWQTELAQRELRDQLSQMLSPYAAIADFRATVTIDGLRIELAELEQRVRDAARIHYEVDFDGQLLTIRGFVKQGFFRGKKQDEYRASIERDNGNGLANYLVTQLNDQQPREEDRQVQYVRRSKSPIWFMEFGKDKPLKDLRHLPQLPKEGIANPGPFRAEVDSFDLGAEAMNEIEEQEVFSSRKQFKEYLKSINGIRVYRDGFGIRVDRDWLNLGKAATSGSSYYALRPANTIGYVAISARANSQLEEKTDREGFKVTPAYITFMRLLDEFVMFSDQAQDQLRRSYLDYVKKLGAQLADVEPGTTPEQLVEDLKEGVAGIRESITDVDNATTAVKELADIDHLVSAVARESDKLPKPLVATLEKHWAVVRSAAARARQSLEAIESTLSRSEQLVPKSSLLAAEVDSFRQRISDVYELASLGLTAEVLSHEIQNVAEHLRGRARRASDHIRRESIRDTELLGFAEYVAASVEALRKQLSHLEPSLRYARDKREPIQLLAFATGLTQFYRARLEARGISIEALATGTGDFSVAMSKGKLTQVFDNLILNSEYWLIADLSAQEINTGSIRIEIDAPHARVSDSGRGVTPDLELRIFDPFVTAKARGTGRGLGLFIVKELLDADGCTISLLPERNEYGRRYIFDLDFTGALTRGE